MNKYEKAGRPKHKPTIETKKQVENLSGMGIPQEQICSIIGICDDTLRKHYEKEILDGKAKANTKIASTLFNKAINGDTPALIFWAKTQMRWKETDKLELTGKDDGPIEISEAKSKLLAGIKKNSD